jgi:hypothetical protein
MGIIDLLCLRWSGMRSEFMQNLHGPPGISVGTVTFSHWFSHWFNHRGYETGHAGPAH